MNDAIRKAFTDRDGALAIPEVVASVGSVSGLCAALWDWAMRGVHLDLQSYGLGIAAIVAGLGAAQRLRDGITREENR